MGHPSFPLEGLVGWLGPMDLIFPYFEEPGDEG
jgi:hypothetical protein